MKHLTTLLLGASLLVSAGCTQRLIYGVQDTPVATAAGTPSTILRVQETTWYAFIPHIKQAFYECGKDGDTLDCVRTCHVTNEEGDRILCRHNFEMNPM